MQNSKLFIFSSIFLFLSQTLFSQEKKEDPKFGIKFSGYIKTDAFYDTRQTVNIREGHFLLYPEPAFFDANKKDINAKPNFNILSIQTRLKGSISGPDAFGAKTSGIIEADFFGNENTSFSDVNGFRLRHAFVKMNWKSTELIVGQYWHPMFIAESFPGVISFNTGAPFQPFSRNPQIRLAKSLGNLKIIACVFSQRDFTSTGPDGGSSKYLRNAAIPNTHLQLQYKNDSLNLLFGAGIDYKSIIPELYTTNNAGTKKYESDKTLNSMSAVGFVNLKLKPLNIKLEGVYAQNAYDMVMIGGYGVKQLTDTTTGSKEFTNLNTVSLWTDFQTNGKKVQFGLFGGFSKNIGSQDSIKGAIYARGANIDYLYRVAPRVIFISGKLNIAFETEYTFAMYGLKNGDGKGKVTNGSAIKNTRALLSFIYNF